MGSTVKDVMGISRRFSELGRFVTWGNMVCRKAEYEVGTETDGNHVNGDGLTGSSSDFIVHMHESFISEPTQTTSASKMDTASAEMLRVDICAFIARKAIPAL